MNKIRKGDTVQILSGEDKGKTGAVQYVYPKQERVIVQGVNMQKKAQRRTGMQVRTQTGIIEREGPMHWSKVAVVCPHCGKPTRVGFEAGEKDSKYRVCRKCGSAIDK
ncbi:MAG: 50S ribosomal protein L24 [Chloroflexi bacterium UTCFX4]|jgi:large subunit ribosomal protein L24|nr:MAG: 50S ribosomal protein L24 [Chloroflexi bacterium UTCFX4]